MWRNSRVPRTVAHSLHSYQLDVCERQCLLHQRGYSNQPDPFPATKVTLPHPQRDRWETPLWIQQKSEPHLFSKHLRWVRLFWTDSGRLWPIAGQRLMKAWERIGVSSLAAEPTLPLRPIFLIPSEIPVGAVRRWHLALPTTQRCFLLSSAGGRKCCDWTAEWALSLLW